MGLRTKKIVFRKNWVVCPDKWSFFFNNLQKDIEDLYNEIKNFDISYNEIKNNNKDIIEILKKDKRIEKL